MSAAPPTAGFPTRWLRAFLSASVAATVATVLPFLWAATENPFVLLALPFVAIPYLALFLVLVAPARRGALWMSLAVGFFVIPLGLLLALDEEEIAWPWTAYFAFLLVAHAALVVTAYKTYNAFYPQPRFLLRATRLLLPAGLAALAFFGLPYLGMRSGRGGDTQAANETRAIGTLRQLNVALLDYAVQDPKEYFPGSLDPLRLRSDAIHPDVLRGSAHRGYTFIYSPGPAAPDGVISTYTLQARPQEFARTGRRSFFTDESAIIRFTLDDRPATSNDPPIE